MFRTARRPAATVALFFLLAPGIAGCMTVQRAPFNGTAPLDQIAGVTTRSGREIRFARRGATITNDTLYAIGRTGQVILPTDSIAHVLNESVSAGRTTALVVGVSAGVAAVAAIIAAIAFANSFGTYGSPW